jgi:hypothetical protein
VLGGRRSSLYGSWPTKNLLAGTRRRTGERVVALAFRSAAASKKLQTWPI